MMSFDEFARSTACGPSSVMPRVNVGIRTAVDQDESDVLREFGHNLMLILDRMRQDCTARNVGSQDRSDELFETLFSAIALQQFATLQIWNDQAAAGLVVSERIPSLLTLCEHPQCCLDERNIKARCTLAANLLVSRGGYLVPGQHLCEVFERAAESSHRCPLSLALQLAERMMHIDHVSTCEIRILTFDQQYQITKDYLQSARQTILKDISELPTPASNLYYWCSELFAILKPALFVWSSSSSETGQSSTRSIATLPLQSFQYDDFQAGTQIWSPNGSPRTSPHDSKTGSAHDTFSGAHVGQKALQMVPSQSIHNLRSLSLANGHYRKIVLATASASLFLLVHDFLKAFPIVHSFFPGSSAAFIAAFDKQKRPINTLWRLAAGLFCKTLVSQKLRPYSDSPLSCSFQLDQRSSYLDLFTEDAEDTSFADTILRVQEAELKNIGVVSSLHKLVVTMATIICNRLSTSPAP